jgi:GDP-fucose transporter C1
MVGLSVLGLTYFSHLFAVSQYVLMIPCSFSNYTLKYVDASFYQVARGLILPFTVATSSFFLHTRPSLLILVACSIVTFGFFVGVFLDGTPISLLGIGFGVASSAITAIHSVVIKKSLPIVNGSALTLSWYTNLLSVLVLAPIVILAGEFPAIMKMVMSPTEVASTTSVTVGGHFTPLHTFLYGSTITVSSLSSTS